MLPTPKTKTPSIDRLILEPLRIFWYTTGMSTVKDGDHCEVIAGTYKGKYGKATDFNTSKTGAITITVVQEDGERFKTLAKNVKVIK